VRERNHGTLRKSVCIEGYGNGRGERGGERERPTLGRQQPWAVVGCRVPRAPCWWHMPCLQGRA